MTQSELQCGLQNSAEDAMDFSSDVLTSSQLRILAIHAKILSDGPISVSLVARSLGLPKSSVSRAIAKLERVNWVQKRMGDGAVQVSAHFKDMMKKADTYDVAWNRIVAKLSPLAGQMGFGFELVVMNSTGEFETVGCSDAALVDQSRTYGRYSKLGAACLAGYGTAVEEDFDLAPIDEGNSFSLEDYARFRHHLKEFRANGALWEEKKRCYIRAMSLPSGESGALRILQGTASSLQKCVALCEKEVLKITMQTAS